MEQFISGELKKNPQSQFPHSPHWSDGRWKVCLAGGGDKKRFQYCTDASGTIVYFRALQGHSRRNLIEFFITGECDNSEQLLPEHLPCGMCCQFTFYHQFGINTWRSKFEQKTVGILSACYPMDKSHKDPDVIDLSVPRHAQYLHKAWKRHQDAVYWSTSILLLRKD